MFRCFRSELFCYSRPVLITGPAARSTTWTTGRDIASQVYSVPPMCLSRPYIWSCRCLARPRACCGFRGSGARRMVLAPLQIGVAELRPAIRVGLGCLGELWKRWVSRSGLVLESGTGVRILFPPPASRAQHVAPRSSSNRSSSIQSCQSIVGSGWGFGSRLGAETHTGVHRGKGLCAYE